MKMRVVLLCVLGAAVMLTGCATTVQYVPFPDQVMRVQDDNKARIYVARPEMIFASASMQVSDGEQVIGYTGALGYLCWERDPGPVVLTGLAENTSVLNLSVEKGSVYYVQQFVHIGTQAAKNELILLDERQGIAAVSSCRPPAGCVR